MAAFTEVPPTQAAAMGEAEPVISNPAPRRRRHSLFDPLPGRADPEARAERKRCEEEHGFGWKPLLLVGLIGTTLWGGFNKSLNKCEQRHLEEDREEEERKRREESRQRRGARSRDRGERTRDRRDRSKERRDCERERRAHSVHVARDPVDSSRGPRWDGEDARAAERRRYERAPRREARSKATERTRLYGDYGGRVQGASRHEREWDGHRRRRPISHVDTPRDRGRGYWDCYN